MAACVCNPPPSGAACLHLWTSAADGSSLPAPACAEYNLTRAAVTTLIGFSFGGMFWRQGDNRSTVAGVLNIMVGRVPGARCLP